MTAREIKWPMLVVALLCLIPVIGGAALLIAGNDGGHALGWALIGFFGSGAVVLGRKALSMS